MNDTTCCLDRVSMDNLKRTLVQDERYKEGLESCMKRPYVRIAPTNYCNFACSYCSTKDIKNKKVNMDIGLVKSLVDQCVENDWGFAFGQTYEPFLHPKINQIIEYVAEKGRRYTSPTNALAIRKDAYDLPMNLVISYSADEHDYSYRNSKISYDKYQEKVLRFVRHRIENNAEGVISLQIADYSIFNGDLTYDKRIGEVEQILLKSKNVLKLLGFVDDVDESDWRKKIANREPLVLFESSKARVQVEPTKIMPNTYEAFIDMPVAYERKGYCDSCFTMMSIQANGDVAFCCCDPSASVIAGTIDSKTDLRAFWYGKEMEEIRDCFDNFTPKHPFCAQCLHNVTEHTKPLLTVKNPKLVAEILSSYGVEQDTPWFSFPKA